MIHRLILLFICIPVTFMHLYSQNYDIRVDLYGVSQGLSQSTVTSIFCDNKGVVWAGTCDGLNIIDGESIEVIRSNSNKENSLPHNIIRSISGTKNNCVWIGTENGACLYNPSTNMFRSFSLRADYIKDKMLKVTQIGEYLLINSREKAFVIYSSKDKTFRFFKKYLHEGQSSSCFFRNYYVWVSGNPAELVFTNMKNGDIGFHKLKLSDEISIVNAIESLNDTAFLIATNKGLFIYNHFTGNESPIPEQLSALVDENSVVKFMKRSPDNKYWLGIQKKGIFCFDDKWNLQASFINQYSRTGEKIYFENPVCIAFGRGGNVFAGTDGSGLVRINLNREKFKHIKPSEIRKNEDLTDFITSICEKDGKIYATALNKCFYIYHNEQLKNIPSDNDLRFIANYSDEFMIALGMKGLVLFDIKNEIFRKPDFAYPEILFTHFEKLNDKISALGSEKGLYLLNDKKLTLFNNTESWMVTFIKALSDNHFVVITMNAGIYLLSKKDDNFRISSLNFADELINQKVSFTSLSENNGYFYWGTSNGLIKTDKSFNIIKTYTVEDGLSGNYVFSIVSYMNMLWVATGNGLSSLNAEGKVVMNYNVDDGLQSPEFNTNTGYVTENGAILFGGINGFNIFHPSEIRLNTTTPFIKLKGLWLYDKELNPDTFILKNNLVFNWTENSFTFLFSLVEFTNPSENKLKVKLKNSDRDWIDLGSRRQIRYSSLSPGTYVLSAIACNNDGYWSDEEEIFRFTIDKPWWRKAWGILLLVLSAIIIVFSGFYLGYIRKMRKKIRELKHLQEIERLRIRISGEIHDDVGSGLSQAVLLSETIKKDIAETGDTELMKRIDKLIQHMRETIKNMGEIVWVMNPKNDNLFNLLIYYRNIINSFSENTGIDVKINFQNINEDFTVSSSFKRKTILIIKEALNNAAKHSEASEIKVNLKLTGRFFELEIIDNGTGFHSDAKSFGNGLTTMKNNASEVNLELIVKSEPGKGTIIYTYGDMK